MKDYKFPKCAKAEIPCNGLGRCDLKKGACVCKKDKSGKAITGDSCETGAPKCFLEKLKVKPG